MKKSKADKPGTKPMEPWKKAVLEILVILEEGGIDEDVAERIYDSLFKQFSLNSFAIERMISDYKDLKQEAERFKKILALQTLQDAWKSLSAEQQELLRKMDYRTLADEITA